MTNSQISANGEAANETARITNNHKTMTAAVELKYNRPKWSYSIRTLTGVTLSLMYLVGCITTIPPLMKLLGNVSKSAANFERVLDHLQHSHGPPITNTSSTTSDLPTGMIRWFFVRSFSAGVDWTTYADPLPEPATHYWMPNFVDEVVPFFVISIIIEFFIARVQDRRRREKAAKCAKDGTLATADPLEVDTRPTYRLNDSINSMSLGTFQQMFHVSMFVKPLIYAPYIYVWENYAVIRFPLTWWSWLLAFLFVEFGYYWYHRFGHEINFLWAAHIAHHSSEEYNLTTALRQGAIQYSSSWLFNLPAAFFIPPPLFSFHQHFNRIYQFWIHTKVIKKMPNWFEFIFNTPSHHRAHHGSNQEYIDCNYGGTLIIFDRIFGTFVPEVKPVVYGLTHNLNSWNPLWANLHHWSYMYRTAARLPTWSRRLEMFWAGPGFKADDQTLWPIPLVEFNRKRYDRFAVSGIGSIAYLIVNFLSNIVVVKYLVKLADSPSHTLECWLASTYILFTIVVIGSWMEGKWSIRRILTIEFTRLVIASILIRSTLIEFGYWSVNGPYALLGGFLAFSLASFLVTRSAVTFAQMNYGKAQVTKKNETKQE